MNLLVDTGKGYVLRGRLNALAINGNQPTRPFFTNASNRPKIFVQLPKATVRY